MIKKVIAAILLAVWWIVGVSFFYFGLDLIDFLMYEQNTFPFWLLFYNLIFFLVGFSFLIPVTVWKEAYE
jgi:hypothetical protein